MGQTISRGLSRETTAGTTSIIFLGATISSINIEDLGERLIKLLVRKTFLERVKEVTQLDANAAAHTCQELHKTWQKVTANHDTDVADCGLRDDLVSLEGSMSVLHRYLDNLENQPYRDKVAIVRPFSQHYNTVSYQGNDLPHGTKVYYQKVNPDAMYPSEVFSELSEGLIVPPGIIPCINGQVVYCDDCSLEVHEGLAIIHTVQQTKRLNQQRH